MTKPDSPIAAAIAIQLARAELLTPYRTDLRRDPDDIKTQLAAERRSYLAHLAYLASRIRDAAERVDVDAAERARTAIDQASQRHRARAHAITRTHAEHPSLLDQLVAAITPSGDTGGTGSTAPAAHRSALGIAAFDLLRHIQQTLGAPDHRDLHDALGQHTDLTDLKDWTTKALGILHPAKRWAMPGRCPNCNRGTVHVPDSSGEVVRRVALELDRETAETRCLHCGTTWPPGRARQLEAVLRQQQEEDAAERRDQQVEATR